MRRYDPSTLALSAIPAAPDRPTVTTAHDHPDGRLIIFRLDPGQTVATHTNASSVFLSVVSGAGFVTGAEGERAVAAGEIVVFAPTEPHGMRADQCQMVVAAIIAPRPGGR